MKPVKNSITSILLLAFLSGLLIFSCGPAEEKLAGEFIIRATLRNSNGEFIRLYHLRTDSIKIIDSAEVDENGSVYFREKAEEPGFFMLSVAPNNFINLLIEPGENIVITGNLRQLGREYDVSGSSGSALIRELILFTRANYARADSLEKVRFSYRDSTSYPEVKMRCDSMYSVIFKNQRDHSISFIRKNAQSLASVFALFQVFGRQRVLSEHDHFDLFRETDSILQLKYKGNPYAEDLHQRVEEVRRNYEAFREAEKKLDTAMAAPNITMNNIGGLPQPLLSLRGYYTLVFFWSSESQPGTDVLPSLKPVHKKYAPKGFQIYAVSLDKNRQDWEDAVREHKLFGWVHVSDLTGWDSPSVKSYCVRAIPAFILIDKKGIILYRGNDTEILFNKLYRVFRF